jgi:hypothetical protein
MDLPTFPLRFDLTGRQVEAFWSVLYTHGYWAVTLGATGSPADHAARKVERVLGPLMDVVPGDTTITVDLSVEEVLLLDLALREELKQAHREERWNPKVHDEVPEIRRMLAEHATSFRGPYPSKER